MTRLEIPIEGSTETYKANSIGANSVSTVLGVKGGMIVSILDIIKIVLPTLLVKLYFPEQPIYTLLAAVGGLIGHIWPIYYKFHGGSGFSAIMGGLLVIDPLAVIAAPIAGLLLGLFIFRHLVVLAISWLWILIPWFWWRTGGDPLFIGYAIALNIIFILAMIPEISSAVKYMREGKLMEWGLGYLNSNPMGRGMLKMARAVGYMKEESKK